MKEKKIITKEQIRYIIEKYRVKITGSWAISNDGLLDIKGSVSLTGNKFYKLPLKFGFVTGDFYCKENGLKTLKGSPKFVGGTFDCSDNELTSLKYAPDNVGGSYLCQENSLSSLKGCPIEIVGRFNCAVNNLESLVDGPKRVGKSYYAHHNRLRTLSGSSVFVGGTFNVAVNLLANLDGCPDYIGESFHFDCWLPSLYMGTKNCLISRVKIESLERIDKGNSILPEVILSSQKLLPILFKYNKYLDSIWDKEGLINEEDLLNALLEIESGLL